MQAGHAPVELCCGEIIDGAAVRAGYDSGKLTGKYVSDFSDPDLMATRATCSHLGASTEEAEETSASMAAETLMVPRNGYDPQLRQFPDDHSRAAPNSSGARLCIVNKNESRLR